MSMPTRSLILPLICQLAEMKREFEKNYGTENRSSSH
jgi:hypothetical protein